MEEGPLPTVKLDWHFGQRLADDQYQIKEPSTPKFQAASCIADLAMLAQYLAEVP